MSQMEILQKTRETIHSAAPQATDIFGSGVNTEIINHGSQKFALRQASGM